LEYLARQYAGEYSKVVMSNWDAVTPKPSANLLWNPPDRPIGMRSKPYHDWMAASKAYSSVKKQYKEKEDGPEAMQILARHPYLEDSGVDDVFKEHNEYLQEVKTEIRELKKLPKTEENLAAIEELEAQMTYETLKRMALLRMVNDGRYKGLFK
jgi:preprotein translocase subunit SecA